MKGKILMIKMIGKSFIAMKENKAAIKATKQVETMRMQPIGVYFEKTNLEKPRQYKHIGAEMSVIV